MEKRVTLKDIAVKAGVTVSCVSQAMRNLPDVSKETKIRIQRLAKELGYRMDPALSALAVYRVRVQNRKYRSTLAFVVDTENTSVDHESAMVEAQNLGYQVDTLTLVDPSKDWQPLLRVIRARGIRGILILPRLRYDEIFQPAKLDDLCLTTIGYSARLPGIHRVSNNQYMDMFLHVESLRKLGYRKIGLWSPPAADRRLNYQFSAGFIAAALVRGERMPPVCVDDLDVEGAREWVKSNQLDAVIGWISHLSLLREAGFRIPYDLGFSTYGWDGGPEVRKVSGLDFKPALLSSAAAQVLHNLLLHNQTGVSRDPSLTLFSGRFVAGATTRKITLR